MVVSMKTTLEQNYNEWLVHSGDFARNMTLRDHFAGTALQGFLAYAATVGTYAPPDDELAQQAYQMADAMLKERAK
jgi:hypothetical protein